MGLTVDSVEKKALKNQLDENNADLTAFLAGTPNVGKSTVFNALTGLNQHTGNWSGKTVTNSVGFFNFCGKKIALVDLPGTYSLLPHSQEEKVARDSICFEKNDVTVVLCDATTLEKCLCLVLQILEITNKVVVCVNLVDQAKKKNIVLDTEKLEELLGVPVVETNARKNEGLDNLCEKIIRQSQIKIEYKPPVTYDTAIETALKSIESKNFKLSRFMKLRLLVGDDDFKEQFEKYTKQKIENDSLFCETLQAAHEILLNQCLTHDVIRDNITTCTVNKAAEIYHKSADLSKRNDSLDRKLDKIFTGKLTGIPIMLLLLAFIFFLTIYAADYPSRLLSKGLFTFGDMLRNLLLKISVPWWIIQPLINGIYRVMAWVVAVMLPPMLIFFPLFTLLEDFGYLPRVAFNLDYCFKKCNTCGKQSLCMCIENNRV